MEELTKKAIDRAVLAGRMAESHYKMPVAVQYSGGKDSDSLLWVFMMAKKYHGTAFTVHHSLTTVDPPPVVRHVYHTFEKLENEGIRCYVDRHEREDGSRLTMWNLIPQKLMPPTRQVRYCCQELKEGSCNGRLIATGVRWEESKKREMRNPFEIPSKSKKDYIGFSDSDEKFLITDNIESRRLFESCYQKKKMVVNPVIDWSDTYLWDVIHEEKIDVCEMYGWGYERLGCIGCPLARKCARERELYDFPAYKRAYIRAFDRMLEMRRLKGKNCSWECGEDVYHWWMQHDNIFPGQMYLPL